MEMMELTIGLTPEEHEIKYASTRQIQRRKLARFRRNCESHFRCMRSATADVPSDMEANAGAAS